MTDNNWYGYEQKDWLAERNKKYTIRRVMIKFAVCAAVVAFIVWGWNLPEV